MRRTGTGLLEVRDFLRVKLDLGLPVQKSSTSVRQRSGRCWHPARAATGCEQNGGNLNQLRHKLQACFLLCHTKQSVPFFTGGDEQKRKFYSCVLVVGGGAKFAGFANWLRSRLTLQIPYQFRPGERK